LNVSKESWNNISQLVVFKALDRSPIGDMTIRVRPESDDVKYNNPAIGVDINLVIQAKVLTPHWRQHSHRWLARGRHLGRSCVSHGRTTPRHAPRNLKCNGAKANTMRSRRRFVRFSSPKRILRSQKRHDWCSTYRKQSHCPPSPSASGCWETRQARGRWFPNNGRPLGDAIIGSNTCKPRVQWQRGGAWSVQMARPALAPMPRGKM
jgi:hypothetical protein